MMPIDLVLVRHGQSEGNLANQFSYAGDKRGFTEAFKARPSWTWRLTDNGVWQAEAAGEWIRAKVWHREGNEFVKKFDRSYVSFFLRAMETAGHLGLGGHWLQELYLRERDWGQLDVMSQQERLTDFAREMNRRERDGIFFAPPGGESMAQLCLRIDRVLHTLHRECSDMQVIIVCHAEVMRAFQLRLERMSLKRFTELMTSEVDTDKIFNGGILHYTRRNPETGEMVITGMGAMHLQIAVERIKRKFGAEIELGTPKIPLRSLFIRGKASAPCLPAGRYPIELRAQNLYLV